MTPQPTREETEAQHQARVEALNSPETPTPTQAEADAMKTGEYQMAGAQVNRASETPEQREAREAREARETPEERAQREAREKRERDMKPEGQGAEYKTR